MRTYRIAKNPGDYALCQRLLKAEGFYNETLGFPTVMLFEDGQLIGLCGTGTQKGMIIAGPIVIKSGQRRPFAALRLAEAYESSLRTMGIKSFIMHTEIGGVAEEFIQRYTDMKPYAEERGVRFYIRHLDQLSNSEGIRQQELQGGQQG